MHRHPLGVVPNIRERGVDDRTVSDQHRVYVGRIEGQLGGPANDLLGPVI